MALNASPATEDPPHLQPGSEVEISNYEPGFRGSWYTATIIKRAPPRHSNNFLIQYTHLFQDEVGNKPLKETFNAVDIRPLAPREPARKFKSNEEVDAFHNDGWWEGVITKELENGNFHVYFKRSKEQLEFGQDQLRLHREWVNGSWTPPLEEAQQVEEKAPTEKEVKSDKGKAVENTSNIRITGKEIMSDKTLTEGKMESNKAVIQERLECENAASKEKLEAYKGGTGEKLEIGKIATEEKFSEGARVEVTSDEYGFKGAWFAATIVREVGKNRYLIRYESLRTEDDSDFLEKEFDTLHIRPYPSEIVVTDQFKMLDEVDALYEDGWWMGMIINVISDSKYQVYFKATNEEMEFKHSDLRLHQDWIDGKWISVSPGGKKHVCDHIPASSVSFSAF